LKDQELIISWPKSQILQRRFRKEKCPWIFGLAYFWRERSSLFTIQDIPDDSWKDQTPCPGTAVLDFGYTLELTEYLKKKILMPGSYPPRHSNLIGLRTGPFIEPSGWCEHAIVLRTSALDQGPDSKHSRFFSYVHLCYNSTLLM
jgi:hypothetical protein